MGPNCAHLPFRASDCDFMQAGTAAQAGRRRRSRCTQTEGIRMLRWLLGAAGAAVVMFVWGFLWWAVLPMGSLMTSTIANEDAVRAVLRAELPATGVYFVPEVKHTPEGDLAPGVEARHHDGPLVHIFYRDGSIAVFSIGYMLTGLLHSFVAALLAGYLLSGVLGSLKTYAKRVLFVALLGVFAAFAMKVGDAVWFYHPLGYELMGTLFTAINWLLAGLVLAAVIKKPLVQSG